MPIDIDRLSEAELIDLNHRIVERLRLIQQMRAHKRMLEFRIGERVVFRDNDGAVVSGTITRYNKKTVSIVTQHGQRWTVPPAMLQAADSGDYSPTTARRHAVIEHKPK